jgi:hypothetical protein
LLQGFETPFPFCVFRGLTESLAERVVRKCGR